MFSERTRRIRSLLVGLTAVALLLSLPATGFAAERENRSGELASAGLLARGAGYGTDAGSKAVRQLQLRLRRLGDRPGPIDGLYGPRTAAAVVRFQRSHGLAIDGVVGPQTKGRLLAQRVEQRPARAPSPPTQTGNPERKSPAPDTRAESVPEPPPGGHRGPAQSRTRVRGAHRSLRPRGGYRRVVRNAGRAGRQRPDHRRQRCAPCFANRARRTGDQHVGGDDEGRD